MRAFALALRIIQQFMNDRRSLAMLVLAPVLLLSLLAFVFSTDRYEPKIALVDVPAPLATVIEKAEATFTDMSYTKAKQQLEDREIDGYIRFHDGTLTVQVEGGDMTKTNAVLQSVQKQMSGQSQLKAEIEFLYGDPDNTLFDTFGPVFISFFSFFLVFVLSGVSFIREQTTGTIDRLMTTPIRHSEVVLGYVMGFGTLVILQTSVIIYVATQWLGIYSVGSLGYVFLIAFLVAMTALTMGIWLSTYATSEFQIVQFIPIAVVPQIFFAGLVPAELFPDWLYYLSYVMPLKYGAGALSDVMIRGLGWDAIMPSAIILTCFSLVFMVLNIVALRKYRQS